MHSYIYQDEESIKDLTANTRVFNLKITSLDDVKKLHRDLKLIQSQKTSYLLSQTHLFSTEIFNSLLKILEEPNENIYFFLQADNYHLPPTILSRCQILKTPYHPQPTCHPEPVEGSIEETIYRITDRSKALELLISQTHYYHLLLTKGGQIKKIATNLSLTDMAYRNIKKNGHLLLNLVNLTINLKSI